MNTKTKKTEKTEEQRRMACGVGYAGAIDIASDLFETWTTKDVKRLADMLDLDDDGLPDEDQDDYIERLKVAKETTIALYTEKKGIEEATRLSTVADVVLDVFEFTNEICE